MKWRSLLFVNILIIGISCQWNELPEKKPEFCEDMCGVDDPLKNLPWLKEKVASLEGKSSSSTYPYFIFAGGI